MTSRTPRFRPVLAIPGAIVLVIAIIGAVIHLRGGASSPLPAKTPVLLITVDTLRPDALGWIAGRNATPNLDRLATEGVAFTNAVSVTPLTLPSHTSLLSGRFPARHGIRDNGQVVPTNFEVLAERLRERGYATGAFVSAYVLRAMFGLDRGFQRYDDELTSGSEGWLDRPAGQTVDAALAWIEGQEKGRPWFAWIHLYDPHTPYAPPAEFAGTDERSQYDGEVRYVDRELGRLLARLEARGEKPLVVFTADHGEAFGEHGEVEHGLFIYDTTTLVPLVFHHPALAPRRPDGQPRLVDVTPTILDLLAEPAIASTDGISLSPLLAGGQLKIPPAYSESFHPWTTYGWAPLAALHDGDWKVIDSPTPELFNLRQDPGELADLAKDDPARTDRLVLALQSHREPADALDATRVEDEATLRKLASLGYVGNASVSDIPTTGLPNPREHLAERGILRNAEYLLRTGQLEQALDAFDTVLATDPRNRFATLRSGITLLKLDRVDEAVDRLKASLALDSSQAETHYALADALTRSGRFAEAATQWMETVRLQPRRAAAWGNLALVLSNLGREAEAADALTTALAIEPDDLRLLQNQALHQRKRGDKPAMIATLQHAARVGGDQFAYSALLGLELYDAGRIEEAGTWLQRVKPSEQNYPESRFRLAQIASRAGDEARASELLQEAIRLNPSLEAVAKADPDTLRLLQKP